MQHLSTLRIFNFVMAGITGLATLMVLVLVIGVAIVGFRFLPSLGAFEDPGAPPPGVILAIVVVVLVLTMLLLLGQTILLIVAGRAVAQARGRILQTILSVLLIGSFPVGTAFAIFGIWVCWMNEPTRQAFDRGSVGPLVPGGQA